MAALVTRNAWTSSSELPSAPYHYTHRNVSWGHAHIERTRDWGTTQEAIRGGILSGVDAVEYCPANEGLQETPEAFVIVPWMSGGITVAGEAITHDNGVIDD